MQHPAAELAPITERHVPSFNERPNVAPMVAKLDAALAGIAWEVIYVDDNSPDGTSREVRRIAQHDPRYAASVGSAGEAWPRR